MKKIHGIILLVLTLVFLTGCDHTFENRIIVNDDHTVTSIIKYAIYREREDNTLSNGEDRTDDVANNWNNEIMNHSERIAILLSDGYEIINNVASDSEISLEASKTFADMTQFTTLDFSNMNSPIIFVEDASFDIVQDEAYFLYDIYLDDQIIETFEMNMDVDAKIILELPGSAGDNNATSVSNGGKTLTWTFDQYNQIRVNLNAHVGPYISSGVVPEDIEEEQDEPMVIEEDNHGVDEVDVEEEIDEESADELDFDDDLETECESEDSVDIDDMRSSLPVVNIGDFAVRTWDYASTLGEKTNTFFAGAQSFVSNAMYEVYDKVASGIDKTISAASYVGDYVAYTVRSVQKNNNRAKETASDREKRKQEYLEYSEKDYWKRQLLRGTYTHIIDNTTKVGKEMFDQRANSYSRQFDRSNENRIYLDQIYKNDEEDKATDNRNTPMKVIDSINEFIFHDTWYEKYRKMRKCVEGDSFKIKKPTDALGSRA